MFETVLGYEIPLAARFFIAFLVVLGLIGLTAWLVRRFGANRLGGSARGRQPRLAVIDAASVDGRRRLVLIRRDNIEHLLMIGGPSDVVIEPNIVRAVGAREVAREPARSAETPAPAPTPAPTRGSQAAETSWPLQPASEPAPRPYRTNVTDEPWLAPEPGARARPASSDSLTGFAAEFSARMNQREAVPAQPEPQRIAPAAPAEPVAPPQTDHNLAEMALQLEAALRRPPENRPPVTDPLAVPSAPPAAKAPESQRPREIKPRIEPRVEPRMEPRAEPKTKTSFDNLEQEMASLLGRPSGKT